jgi:tRNA pseudouridine38-40 synthase
MPRYFIEVAYKGTAYSGFQVQQNAVTIQFEVEKALSIYFKQSFSLTGASRTDAGVHALQNYFHFDTEDSLDDSFKVVYSLNAILPRDIVIKKIFHVKDDAHCRFDAILREYKYYLYCEKDPFLQDRAYYFPYKTDITLLKEAASLIMEHTDFTSFSKRNTQVKNFICNVYKSEWNYEANTLVYNVQANRFLRGMVKGIVGTMLMLGMNKISLKEFNSIILNKDCTKANFSVPAHALFLVKVAYNK